LQKTASISLKLASIPDASALDFHFLLNKVIESEVTLPVDNWVLQSDEENIQEIEVIKKRVFDIYDSFVYWRL